MDRCLFISPAGAGGWLASWLVHLRNGGDEEDRNSPGVFGGWDDLGAVGLPRLEPGAETAAALHRLRRRTLG